jgi:hypothetical protein
MFKDLNERMKKLSVVDAGLVKLSAAVFGVLVVKVFPGLINIDYWVLIVLVIALGLKPLYVVWVKK